MQETYFKQLIIFKILLFVLIIIWGGTVQMNNANNSEINNFSTIRNLLFTLFSLSYFFASYKIYKFKNVGRKLFIPLVITFIVLGFLGEFLYSLEINQDLFYLIIFYIVSPLFFVVQGIVAGMLYFSEISNNFSWNRRNFDFSVHIKVPFPNLFSKLCFCRGNTRPHRREFWWTLLRCLPWWI